LCPCAGGQRRSSGHSPKTSPGHLIHPLVVSVRTIDRSDADGGYDQTYRVTDRIPMGPVHLAGIRRQFEKRP